MGLLEKLLRSKVVVWILLVLPGLWPLWPIFLRPDPSVLADPLKFVLHHLGFTACILLAVVLAIASPQVVFSCFSSATMWLVLGGLIIAEAVGTTGLGRRFASVLFERYVRSYGALMIAVAVAATVLAEQWKALATNVFDAGAVLGCLLTIPAAKVLGRRPMYGLYFLVGGASVLAAFGLPLAPQTRLYMYFPIGLAVWGITASFSFYLPELFPTRLRGTGVACPVAPTGTAS